MASKKKPSSAKKAAEAEMKVIVLSDGSEQEIVREDGKYYYTATSQFRKATHTPKTIVLPKEEPATEEPIEKGE